MGWDLGEFSVRSGRTDKCTQETAKACPPNTRPSDEGDLSAAHNARCVLEAAPALLATGASLGAPPPTHAAAMTVASGGLLLALFGPILLVCSCLPRLARGELL